MVKPMFVFLIKRNGIPYRWVVKVTINKERRYVGCFKTKPDAVNALNRFLSKNKSTQKALTPMV